jgi:hypothetical protein
MPDALDELCFAGCEVVERFLTAEGVQCRLGRKREAGVEII